MGDGVVKKGGHKNRKYGRNKPDCERYRSRGVRERNKARKLRKHLQSHCKDSSAVAALRVLKKKVA